MGMTGSGKGGRRAMAEINVTPLVDVMLVLLIIFMVATPLIDQDELTEVDVNLPVTADNPQTVNINDTDKLILEIDGNLVVRIHDEVITDCSDNAESADAAAWQPCFDEIADKLGNNMLLAEQETLYLLADTAIPYGFVVGAMNRLRLAGVTNVGMVTNPELR